jgi:hypothetical protein
VTSFHTYFIKITGYDKENPNQAIARSHPISVIVKATDVDDKAETKDQNPITNPAVLTTVITTIGGIIAALIALKKRASSHDSS